MRGSIKHIVRAYVEKPQENIARMEQQCFDGKFKKGRAVSNDITFAFWTAKTGYKRLKEKVFYCEESIK